MKTNHRLRLPAEWELQRFVLLALPHLATDWAYMLEEVRRCYLEVIRTILRYESVVVVCNDIDEAERCLQPLLDGRQRHTESSAVRSFVISHGVRLVAVEIPTNDTWARDFGGITVFDGSGGNIVLDFGFNGWGLKFAANLDNLVTRRLFDTAPNIVDGYSYRDCRRIVLEGGSIETNGCGTILTSSHCLLSDNRNGMSRQEIEQLFGEYFGAYRTLWLEHGALQGDDTDSHIDTLARFCDPTTIAYVQCTDTADEHYDELRAMEDELRKFRTADGKPYRLIPLPMADAVVDSDGQRLPATYANFLIINGAVIVPSYGSPKDAIAEAQLQSIFPDRTIETVDCLPLICQHGSLHCITMQFPACC